MSYQQITHPIDPYYDSLSEILILGSFPSVKSREQLFFYGHKQNRFWKVIANVFGENTPDSITEKKEMLKKHHIAIYDVIYSCEIVGSSDSSIRNVVPTDLKPIIEQSKIKKVICNGKTSGLYYKKYQEHILNMQAISLPSTSPANAAWSIERLTQSWKDAIFDMS